MNLRTWLKPAAVLGRGVALIFLVLGLAVLEVNGRPTGWMGRPGVAEDLWTQRLLFPKAALAVAWEAYGQRRYAPAAKLAHYFNHWQPTVESVLFEGRCRQEMGQTDHARSLYRKAHRFDPHSRAARLALIDLDLRMVDGLPPAPEAVDALLALVPWDDGEAVEKIASRLAGMAEGAEGSRRLQLAVRVFYLGPSPSTLRRAALALLRDGTQPEGARGIGAWIIAASLLEERGRLGQEDLERMEQLLPGWVDQATFAALAAGEFQRVSAEEMGRRMPGLPPAAGPGRPFPVCLERDWLRTLGERLRALDDSR